MEQEILDQLEDTVEDLLEENNGMDAIPIIRQGAHWGSLKMQVLAKEIYQKGGYGIYPNPKMAFDYARLAAMNRDVQSMFDLGMMFKEGLGTGQDLEKAFYFLKKAADANLKDAYDPLAVLYMKKKDFHEARALLEKADSQDPVVQKHLRMLELSENRKS